MLPRKERLTRAGLAAALVRARRFSSPHFSYAVSNTGVGCAVIVPKAVARSSVARHRIKRRVFDTLARIPRPKALVVYAKKGSGALSFAAVHAEIRAAISQIG